LSWAPRVGGEALRLHEIVYSSRWVDHQYNQHPLTGLPFDAILHLVPLYIYQAASSNLDTSPQVGTGGLCTHPAIHVRIHIFSHVQPVPTQSAKGHMHHSSPSLRHLCRECTSYLVTRCTKQTSISLAIDSTLPTPSKLYAYHQSYAAAGVAAKCHKINPCYDRSTELVAGSHMAAGICWATKAPFRRLPT